MNKYIFEIPYYNSTRYTVSYDESNRGISDMVAPFSGSPIQFSGTSYNLAEFN